MKLLLSTIRAALPVAGYLLLSSLAAAEAFPSTERAATGVKPVSNSAAETGAPTSPLIPRSLPGTPQGFAETTWLGPFVLSISCSFLAGEEQAKPQEVVRWYDVHGRILKEISGLLYSSGDMIQQLVKKKMIIHGLSGRWKVTLPFDPHPSAPSGWIRANGDTLIIERSSHPGRTIIDVYSSGKLVGSAGPFVIRMDIPELGENGCTTLMTWKDERKEIPQVVIIGPDAKIRLQLDCGNAIGAPYPTTDSKGFLFEVASSDQILPTHYQYLGADGVHLVLDKLPKARPLARFPAGDLVLFGTESEPERVILAHVATGEILWNVPCPARPPPFIGVQALLAEDKILLLGLDVAALDAKNGKVLAIWKSPWKPGDPPPSWTKFFRKGSDVYIVSKKEFFKLDFTDIETKRNGWQ